MVMAFATGRTEFEYPAQVRMRPQRGIYNFFVALLGISLIYLVMSRGLSERDSMLGLQEIKAAAARQGIAERRTTILSLERELANEPLDAEVLKKLSSYWAASGDKTRGDGLALILARRSFRDAEAQALALDISLRQQDYGRSISILDGILRTKEKTLGTLFPLLRAFAENPRSQPSLVAVLGNNPPWRADFLNDLAKNGENTNIPFQLMAKLKGTASPPQEHELRGLISRLLKDRSYDRAYYVWLDSLPAQDLKRVGLVFDGGFESDNHGLFFDWTFQRRKNVDVRIISRANSQADNALRIDFAKNISPFADVSQTLYLAAGHYRLEGEARTDNLQNERGLMWKILCVSENKQLLAATPRHKGTSDWSPFSADFSVPLENCEMQRLVLVLDASSALDQSISGRVWYDNLKIINLDLVQTK